MKYLLDSNVCLEAITKGAHSQEAEELISRAPRGWFTITDFALHTIGLVLAGKSPESFIAFIEDVIRLRIFTVHLTPTDLPTVVQRMSELKLDFDDAFQYLCAERDDLRIVSFDADFDRTPRGRLTPAQALAEIAQQKS